MKAIKLTATELRALEQLLWCNPCSSGCAFEEMQSKKKVDCDNCLFTKAVESIQEKVSE